VLSSEGTNIKIDSESCERRALLSRTRSRQSDDGRTKITSAGTEQLRKATDNLEINSVLIDRNDSEDRIKRREEEKRGNADGRRMAVAASRDGNRTR